MFSVCIQASADNRSLDEASPAADIRKPSEMEGFFVLISMLGSLVFVAALQRSLGLTPSGYGEHWGTMS